jgi:hypothetical protein
MRLVQAVQCSPGQAGRARVGLTLDAGHIKIDESAFALAPKGHNIGFVTPDWNAMDTVLTVVILLLTLLLILIVLLYFFTQQGFRDVVARMGNGGGVPMAATASARSADSVRRERSVAHDQLVLIEADLSINPREALTPEEIESFEGSRKSIKLCNAELKKMGQWMGLPFDLEWVEIQQRQPQLNELYRKFVEATLEKAEQGGS